jgi:CIC family chloride channel protein
MTAMENASDLIVLGWPGYTNTAGKLFGSVVDPIVDNPPVDVVVVRPRKWQPLKNILVPVTEGANSRRAVKAAVNMAKACFDNDVGVTVLHVLPPNPSEGDHIRGQHALADSVNGIEYSLLEKKLVEGPSPYETIMAESQGYELIVVGATEEPLFRNFLVGTLPERIARNAQTTVMMVKRRSGPLHSFVRQALLEPTQPKPLDDD